MDSLQCGFAADTKLGPSVSPCRREFDFTIVFEEVVLVVIPAAVFVVLAIASLLSLHRAPILVRHGRLHPFKLFSATTLAVAQFAILSVQLRLANKTAVSIPSAVVSLIASILIPLVSHVEHLKSRRPSSLLVPFLSLTCLLDAVRTRTYWLSREVALASTLSVAVAIRLVSLYLEAQNKGALLLARDEKTPAEVLAGPIRPHCVLLAPWVDDEWLSWTPASGRFQPHRRPPALCAPATEIPKREQSLRKH